MKITEVVAGIIWKDGKILLARRGNHKSLPGKWEFPGGKIEHGESPEIALERELLEEFNIKTKTRKYFTTNEHQYPDFRIRLICFHSDFTDGHFSLTDHDQIVWCNLEDIDKYDFAEADIPVMKKLRTFGTHR
jgi:8-oxo-dGTP diphosphatase